MVKGIYTSVSGMIPKMNQMTNISDNLANQTTSGYKKGQIFLRKLITAKYALDHAMGRERTEVPEDFRVDYSQGTFNSTDNTYDIALNGSGFFKVADSQGNVSYTRNGKFSLDSKGFLINSSGMNLLNERNKPIKISGVNVSINGNGEIMENGAITDTIGLADFSSKDYLSLRETDKGLFVKPANVNETATNPDTQFLQGYLEDSNVEPVMTMVDMIELFRVFELGQKSIQIQDQSIGKSVNEVGVVK